MHLMVPKAYTKMLYSCANLATGFADLHVKVGDDLDASDRVPKA